MVTVSSDDRETEPHRPAGDEPTVRVGVGAVIERDGRWLVLRRSGSHGDGLWGLVGGHQEFGETPEQTAVREVGEEVGLVARATGRVDGYSDDIFPADGKHYITLFVTCDVDGEPRNLEPDRASEMSWLSPAELRTRDDVFPPLRWLAAHAGQRHGGACTGRSPRHG